MVVTAFSAVVTLLLGGLCTIVWNDFALVREDVSTLRQNATGIRHDLSDARVEFTKAIVNVEKEVATTNGKLDSIVLELQRPHPRR